MWKYTFCKCTFIGASKLTALLYFNGDCISDGLFVTPNNYMMLLILWVMAWLNKLIWAHCLPKINKKKNNLNN